MFTSLLLDSLIWFFDLRLKFSLLSLPVPFDTSRSIYAQICMLSAAFHLCYCLLGSAKFIEYAFRRQVLVGTREIPGGRFVGRPQHGQRRFTQGPSVCGGTTTEGRPRACGHGWLLPIHSLHAIPS